MQQEKVGYSVQGVKVSLQNQSLIHMEEKRTDSGCPSGLHMHGIRTHIQKRKGKI